MQPGFVEEIFMWNTKIGRRIFAASLAIESAISFPGIPEWEGIQKREMKMFLAALRMAFDVINYVIALIIPIVICRWRRGRSWSR